MSITGKDNRFFMASLKLGPKGQIVIPKEAREMFGLEPGSTVVLLADRKKGIALQTMDQLAPMVRKNLSRILEEDEQ